MKTHSKMGLMLLSMLVLLSLTACEQAEKAMDEVTASAEKAMNEVKDTAKQTIDTAKDKAVDALGHSEEKDSEEGAEHGNTGEKEHESEGEEGHEKG